MRTYIYIYKFLMQLFNIDRTQDTINKKSTDKGGGEEKIYARCNSFFIF